MKIAFVIFVTAVVSGMFVWCYTIGNAQHRAAFQKMRDVSFDAGVICAIKAYQEDAAARITRGERPVWNALPPDDWIRMSRGIAATNYVGFSRKSSLVP